MSKNLKGISLFRDHHPFTIDKRNRGRGIMVEEKGLQSLATGRGHAVPGTPPQAAADQRLGTGISRSRLQNDFTITLSF